MEKLRLELVGLEVQSFDAGDYPMEKRKRGTVEGHEITAGGCPGPTSDVYTCKYPTLAQDCCVPGWSDNDPGCQIMRLPSYWCSSETQPGSCS